jgi:P27 family predicted phage terminase small subunit
MAKPGPPRKPLAVLKKEGSKRGKGRPEDKDREINEVKGLPPMPTGMSLEAIRIWRQLSGILEEMGVVTGSDVYLMHEFCVVMALLQETRAKLQDGTYKYYQLTPTGEKDSPQSKRCDIWHAQTQRMMGKMGLSPSDRASLGTPLQAEPEDEGKKRFFAGGK